MTHAKKAALQPFRDRLQAAVDRCPAWTANKATLANHKEEATPEEEAALNAWEEARDALDLAYAWWDQVHFPQRIVEETQAVLDLIEQNHGKHLAHEWLWTCTPYPAGLPSQSQLAEGRQIADGSLTFEALRNRVAQEMAAAMARHAQGA